MAEKVSQCPRCGQELDHLLSVQDDVVTYQFTGEDYTEVDREADTISEPVFICPWCREQLAIGEKAALDILKGQVFHLQYRGGEVEAEVRAKSLEEALTKFVEGDCRYKVNGYLFHPDFVTQADE